MKKKDLNSEYFHKKIMGATWEGVKPFYSDEHEDIQIKIRPNKDVPQAIFKPDPIIPGGWIAHPDTIKSMKKELLIGGTEFIDTEVLYQCIGCNKVLDAQFWIHCPYCTKSIPDKFEPYQSK
ncbi:MAG: hypothetical protein DRQ88_10365 [Epsilonproteobacteria bacterium]|nr:MAG: hypothetical protein DRQ88_10365 [Campylobacterota bacterium]RLA65377.1 MAG: hypothetical protein DRQ89_01265 [Campylobacterota bacterium]